MGISSGFGAFAATLQFYLYGRRYLTASGWTRTSSSYDVAALDRVDLTGACALTRAFTLTIAPRVCIQSAYSIAALALLPR